MSWRQNELGANIAQGVVTPKLQFPNLLLNPYLLVPSLVSAAVCAPVATVLFHFRSTYTLGWDQFATYMAFGVVVPGVMSLVIYLFMKKAGLIGENQLHLEVF